MKFNAKVVTAVTLMVFGACITAPKRLDNIPLLWKPTSQTSLGTVPTAGILDTKIRFEAFKDVRTKPELIAENHEDPTPKTVTTRDSVSAFVTTHLREAFDRAGMRTVDTDGDVVISGEIRQFFVQETTTYQGEVLLRVVVRRPSGEVLWSGAGAGSSKRFGRSYSAENYYETLSDAILSAASALLQDADFQKALAHGAKAK